MEIKTKNYRLWNLDEIKSLEIGIKILKKMKNPNF
jgi:hypothetical protein